MPASTYSREYQLMLRRLQAARKKTGLSQQEVADALGMSQSQVSKIERGERRIDPIELKKLAKLYGKGISDFVP